jgi:signal transduction histidine kinase
MKFLSSKSIRSRLFRLIVLIAFLPATIISIASLIFGYYTAHRNAVERLDGLVLQNETIVTNWSDSVRDELKSSLHEPFVLERAQVTLNLAKDDIYYSYYQEGTVKRIQRYLVGTQLIDQIFLLDKRGKIVISSHPGYQEIDFSSTDYFRLGKNGTSIEINKNSTLPVSLRILSFYPVVDLNGAFLGVIAATVKENSLIDLLSTPTDTESHYSIYLINQNQQRIDSTGSSIDLSTENTDGSVSTSEGGIRFGIYRNQNGQLVYGVRKWIASPGITLVVEQDYTDVFGTIFTNLLVNLAIILIGLLVTGWIALITSQNIAKPLVELSASATRIADGDVGQPSEMIPQDEISLLTNAFQRMTTQLQNSIATLEQHVDNRTIELKESTRISVKRALQLEISQQISQEITSILNIDELLQRVVRLIATAFSYYSVSLYLYNQESETLIWQSGSNSNPPKKLVLTMDDGSLNGKAAINRQPVMIEYPYQTALPNQDENFHGNRFELAIPLCMGDELIGTLDVYNLESCIFPEDIKVLQGLGDQIVIAIHNARLYKRSKDLAVLEERNRLARDLHDSISQLLYGQMLYAKAGQKILPYKDNQQLISYLDELHDNAMQALKEMRLLIFELHSPLLEEHGLIGVIQHRLEMVERRAGIEVDFQANDLSEIPSEFESDLFGIIQESLNNTLKHARAKSILVEISYIHPLLTLTIVDDGIGFYTIPERSGLGLQSMRERAAKLCGEISIISEPGCGTRVEFSIGKNHG